jgi:hypothetical protein
LIGNSNDVIHQHQNGFYSDYVAPTGVIVAENTNRRSYLDMRKNITFVPPEQDTGLPVTSISMTTAQDHQQELFREKRFEPEVTTNSNPYANIDTHKVPTKLTTELPNAEEITLLCPSENPKVFHEYLPFFGKVPRKIIIERVKRKYSLLGIDELLNSITPDSNQLSGFLKIEQFDNVDFDTRRPIDWVMSGKRLTSDEAIYTRRVRRRLRRNKKYPKNLGDAIEESEMKNLQCEVDAEVELEDEDAQEGESVLGSTGSSVNLGEEYGRRSSFDDDNSALSKISNTKFQNVGGVGWFDFFFLINSFF